MRIYKYGRMRLSNLRRLSLMQNPKLINFFWEATKRCNLHCKHCFANAGEGYYADELTTREIKTQLKKIAEKNDLSKLDFSVTGGEPLARADLFDVMAYAYELGYNWGMATNGTLIDDAIIQKMKETGMKAVTISLDGIGKTHDKLRGCQGSYEKVLESVKKLRATSWLKNIQITTVFNKHNLSEIYKLYEIVKNSGANSWQVLPIEPLGRANDNKDILLSLEDYRTILDFIRKARKDRQIKINFTHSHFLGLKYEFEVRDSCCTCLAGITNGGILANGDVIPCVSVPRISQMIQGNVKDRDFPDIWENEFKTFRQPNFKKSGKCSDCINWDFCGGGSVHTWDFKENKQDICLGELS